MNSLPLLLLAITAAASMWGQSVPLSVAALQPHNVKVEQAMYKGKSTVRVTDAAQPEGPFVNGAEQATLLVNDLKRGAAR